MRIRNKASAPLAWGLRRALCILCACGVGLAIDARAGEPSPSRGQSIRRLIRQLPPGAAALPIGMTDYGVRGDPMRSTETGLTVYPPAAIPLEVLAPLPASSFEEYVSRAVDPSGKTRLRQFGFEHFLRAPSTFAPIADVPVGPDYMLGPGDELAVTIWGRIERRDAGVVSRDGTLTLPVIGAVPVAGVRFGGLRGLLRSHYDRHYVGYELAVSLARLRTIAVHVVGAVRRPGTYELGSTSTIFSALSAAAGPTKLGSMREVRLVRTGKVIARLDLYDLFLTGDATAIARDNERLMSGDVVFVPRARSLVALGGAVRSPGIYEIGPEGASLAKGIEYAGGLAFGAAPSRVQIERVGADERIVLESVDLSRGMSESEGGLMKLRDGDIVRVESVPMKLGSVVYLRGNVARPGRRGYRPGMRVSDLLEGEELGSAAFWSGRKLGAAEGEGASPGDRVVPKPYWDFALVRRISLPDLEEVLVPFNLANALARDPVEDVMLQPQDTVVIYAESEFRPAKVVRSAGALEKPGVFPFSPGMTVRDLVALSGGLSRDAYLRSAELTRTWLADDEVRTERKEIGLEGALASAGPSVANPALKRDDYLFVRRVPDAALNMTVGLEGELRFPGTYRVTPGERLSDVIARAGGFTGDAYLRGVVFLRESTRKVQQGQLSRAITDLQAQNAAMTAMGARGVAADPELAAAMAEAAARRRSTIERLKAAKAQGRIVIGLGRLETFKGTADDLVLEAGDRLIVPTAPSTVTVMGSVYASTAIVHRPGRTVARYIAECGGTTPNADNKNIFVLRADGSVASRRQRGLGGFVWREREGSWAVRDLLTASPGPGDVVMVPEKLQPRIYPTKLAKDLTQILYQIAMTAGVVFAVF